MYLATKEATSSGRVGRTPPPPTPSEAKVDPSEFLTNACSAVLKGTRPTAWRSVTCTETIPAQ